MPSVRNATLLRAAEIAAVAREFSHPWNPDSRLVGTQLGRRAGLERTGVTLARMPPGKESFVYHLHHCEEEWIYILQGRAVVEIDGEHHELGPGDFVGFPAPSVAHHLRNPFDVDCVYLMGGEHRPVEIADFPRLGKRAVRIGDQITEHDLAAERSMFAPPEQEEQPASPEGGRVDRNSGARVTSPRDATPLRADEVAAIAHEFSHPWNPSSRLVFAMLGRRAGLERTGLNLGRVPPGKESFAYHRHLCEEEWIYILEGRAVVEIDGEHHELGPGDFVGFPTPSVAHQLRNPFDRECVYLMGGESRAVEIGDFPRLGKRMLRFGGQETTYDLSAERPMFGPPDTRKE